MDCALVYSSPQPGPYYRPGPVRRGSAGASAGIAVAAIVLGTAPDVIAPFTGMPNAVGVVLVALPLIPVLIYCTVVAPTPGRRTATILLLILAAGLDVGAILLARRIGVLNRYDWGGLAIHMLTFLPAQLVVLAAWGTARRVGAAWWFCLLAGVACAAAWSLGIIRFDLLRPLRSALPSDDVGWAVFTVISYVVNFALLFVVPIAIGAGLDRGAATQAGMSGPTTRFRPGAYPPAGYPNAGYPAPAPSSPRQAPGGPGFWPRGTGTAPSYGQPQQGAGPWGGGQQGGQYGPPGRPPNTAVGPNDPFGRR